MYLNGLASVMLDPHQFKSFNLPSVVEAEDFKNNSAAKIVFLF